MAGYLQAVAALAATAALAGSAGATILTFDDLRLPDGTVITNQYQAMGVVFAPLNGQLELRTASTPLFPDRQGLAEIPYFTSVIIADFPRETATMAGAHIDFGGIGNGVRLQAFSGLGGTGSLLASATTLQERLLAVAVPGIRSVRFEAAGTAATSYLIDHFTFEVVPAPSGLWVLMLLGVAAGRRKRPAC